MSTTISPPAGYNRTGAGATGAFDSSATYDEHAGEVFRTAYSILADPHLAADVTQDVFARLWARPDRFDPARGELGGYLKLIARSRAIDVWRRSAMSRRLQERLEDEAPKTAQTVEDAFELAGRRATAQALRTAVDRLPDAQRDALRLAYWGGLSAPEIAARCGTPVGTVKSRIRLGLARLREDPALASL